MKPLFFALLLSLFTSLPAFSQSEPALAIDRSDIMPPIQESHAYTYVVEEDGTARVWLRIDGIKPQTAPGTYTYTLPAGFTGQPMAWYKENGCLEYRNDICVYYGNTHWKELVLSQKDQTVSLTLPASRFTGRYGENNLTLGIAFNLSGVTNQHWWGRTVEIVSGTTSEFISYLNIGVYLPEGVYTRDKTQGPPGWSAGIAETLSASQNRPTDLGAGQPAQTAMFDLAGSGQIYRYRQNLSPGQDYRFNFMSSTSLWRLYYPEIGLAIGWLVAIGAVLALLLRLIIGQKPLAWYFSVLGLLVLLGILVGGLWFTYHTAFGGNSGYPTPMMGGFGGGKGVEVLPAPLEVAPAPAE